MSEALGKRNGLSFRDRCAILEFLKTVCVAHEGFALYQRATDVDGEFTWTDAAVAVHMANALGRPVTTANVAYIREEILGPLAPAKAADPAAALAQRVESLEKDNERIFNEKNRLEGLVETLTRRLDVLERRLPVFDGDARMVPRSVAHAAA